LFVDEVGWVLSNRQLMIQLFVPEYLFVVVVVVAVSPSLVAQTIHQYSKWTMMDDPLLAPLLPFQYRYSDCFVLFDYYFLYLVHSNQSLAFSMHFPSR
jgi:hypothetical protein